MKTIAVLRANPKDAGIGKILKTLSNEYMVDCYIWDRQGDYQPVFEHKNLKYKRCMIRAGFYSAGTLLKMLLFEAWLFIKLIMARLDYIHAVDLDTGLVGLCVAKLKRKPFVYHCLDPYYAILPARWPKILGRIARRIENMVISNADVFIITDMLRMPQHEGATPRHVVEILNVPILNSEEISNKRNVGEFVVGYIGALAEGRNLITIVEAIGELADEGVSMVIGGFGPIEYEVKTHTNKYSNIKYIGFVPYPKVLEIERKFDLFVYISDPEDESQRWVSPNKLFEGMALGKPIIVGEGTLVADRVSDIGNGIVIKYGSKEELQKAILRFKNNPHLI
ncbi:MAG: glycosyltransferase, partial [Nitrospirota bacterium]|nr:glycosyltransferase [Nitrospirota bacterium]